MAITKVTEGVRTLGTGEVATANMATDPTNASNLSSGSVPLAQLGNVDTTAIIANQDDIALLGFKVAANGSLARYNLVDQSIDAFEDASGVDASASTNEIRNTSNYYSGVASAPTGGTITTYTSGENDYIVHSFLADGNFVVGASGNVDALVIGGGGAGGVYGGGGAAGGFRTSATHAVTAQTYAITVGDGGGLTGGGQGIAGEDSVFSTITSTGGGEGGGNGGDGGSGGGAGSADYLYSVGSGNTPSTSPSQGNDGGLNNTAAPGYAAGGGGGAGAVGGAASSNQGGAGGAGATNDYRTGSSVTYAGGGGGGIRSSGPAGAGGSGGGGAGSVGGSNATNGTANTGSGGGGAGTSDNGGTGGSGIVVIRFIDGTLNPANNMTLVSNAVTAESAPTTGDLVMTYTNGAGTATINTDLKAYVSRDNGTTYTQATLADQGDTGGHTILTANGLDISGQPSGTSMRWKIETLNQSESKQTRIQAVSLGWS